MSPWVSESPCYILTMKSKKKHFREYPQRKAIYVLECLRCIFLGGIFVWLIVHRGMHHNSPPAPPHPQPPLPTLDLGNCLRPPTLGTLPTLLQMLKQEYPIIVFPLQGLTNIYHLILVVAIIPLIMVQWIPFVQRGDKFRWNWNFRFGGNCEAGNCQIPPGSHQKWPGLKNRVLAKKHVWKRAGFSKFFLHWSETISFQHEWNGGLYCGVIYSHCCPGFVQWCFIWRWHNIEMAWALNLTSTVSQLPWLKNFFNSRCRPGPCACQSNALPLNVELLNRSLLQMTPHFIPMGQWEHSDHVWALWGGGNVPFIRFHWDPLYVYLVSMPFSVHTPICDK